MVAAVLVAGLSGCSGSSDAKGSTIEKSPTSAVREGTYVRLVQRDVPELAARSRANLLNIGRSMCDAVTVGDKTSTLRVLKALLDEGIAARHAGALMGYASALCPEKQSALSIT